MAEKQRRKLHRESKLTDGLLNPDNLLEVPIQIIELQRERALDDLPEIKQVLVIFSVSKRLIIML
jgi:hypothetical protein